MMLIRKLETPETPDKGIDIDLLMETTETGQPPLLIPLSERAKKLFTLMGMDDDCVGIVGNFNPLELEGIIPDDYILRLAEQSRYHGKQFQEITLPDELPVVH